MAGVEGDQDVRPAHGVAHIELVRADGVAFGPDAEDLALHRVHHAGDVLGEDLVVAVLQALTGGQGIHRHLLGPVGDPVVDDAGLAGARGEVAADFPHPQVVLNPEAAHLVVRGGKGAVLAQGVGEEGGVEIQAVALLHRPVGPGGEMLGLQGVAVHVCIALVIAGVDVDLLRAGDEAQGEIHVGAQLLGGAGLAGIVAGGLDAAGQGAAGFLEAGHVVPLPAVNRNRRFVAQLHGFVDVHAVLGIQLLGHLVAFLQIVHMSSPFCGLIFQLIFGILRL